MCLATDAAPNQLTSCAPRSGLESICARCYCVHRVRNHGNRKDWRARVPGESCRVPRLEAGKALAITRHGETVGFYIPAQKKSRKAEVEAMRAAAKELDSMIAAWGVSGDELLEEFQELRRAGREKRRNAR